MLKALGALRRLPFLCKALFLALLFLPFPLPGLTLVEVENPSGNFFFLLKRGEEVRLSWRNSLFGQEVTERFLAQGSFLWLEEVAFEDKISGYTMKVTPQDLADLYHTGGAFRANGIHKPFSHAIFRVGAIGRPRLKIKGREIDFQEQAGFGGIVVLRAKKANFVNLLLASAKALVRRLPSWLSSFRPDVP